MNRQEPHKILRGILVVPVRIQRGVFEIRLEKSLKIRRIRRVLNAQVILDRIVAVQVFQLFLLFGLTFAAGFKLDGFGKKFLNVLDAVNRLPLLFLLLDDLLHDTGLILNKLDVLCKGNGILKELFAKRQYERVKHLELMAGSGQFRISRRSPANLEAADTFLKSQFADAAHGRISDPSLWHIDDPLECIIVG